MKKFLSLAIIFAVFTQSIECAIIARGNTTTSPYNFSANINVRALDPYSGVFYVGLANNDSAEAYTLSRINRYFGQPAPQFIGIAPTDLQGNSTTNRGIDHLTLSYADNAPARLVGSAIENGNNNKKVFLMKGDGTNFSQTPELLEADGLVTSQVDNVAASNTHIIAPLEPNSGQFGADGSGLALIAINDDLSLSVRDANTGLNGNLAIALNNTSEVFKGTSGGQNVTINSAGKVKILYDKHLNLFYIGVDELKTGGSGANDIGKSIAIARVDASDNNSIKLLAITPDTAIDNTIITQIVALKRIVQDLFVHKLNIMHTSTGPSYLIISGGSDATKQNLIQALPLVDNPSKVSEHGTLAKKDSALVNNKFVTAATAIGDLPLNDEKAVLVGNGAYPFEAGTVITDLVVIGDTVYISVATSDSDNEPGIFYSQALFETSTNDPDESGKIIGWTPWTKKVLPRNAFPGVLLPGDTTHNGAVSLFQVDPVNGKVWFVEGTTNQVVGTTAWRAPLNATDNSLAQRLNSAISTGVNVALDLDQSTRGFVSQNTARYALFAGANKIAFARTSVAASSSADAVQTPITDFSDDANFLLTTLPSGSQCCQALEYSRRLNTDTNENYFFAGTTNGLYVFANVSGSGSVGDGFTISSSVNGLDSEPFSTSAWFKADNISGSILAIKTIGLSLYILTQEVNPFRCTLYRVNFMDNIDDMFADSNIYTLARTGADTFKDIGFLYDIGIISMSTNPTTQEQIVLATSKGLYFTRKANGSNTATSDSDALWLNLESTNDEMQIPFLSITTPDNGLLNNNVAMSFNIISTTMWATGLVDPLNNTTYNKTKLFQIVGTEAGIAASNVQRIPRIFTNLGENAGFTTVDPGNRFFTDGARRFFIINSPLNPTGGKNLFIQPFDTDTWHLASQSNGIVRDQQLQNIEAMYWIHQIGATGTIFMGTEKGVYTLD